MRTLKAWHFQIDSVRHTMNTHGHTVHLQTGMRLQPWNSLNQSIELLMEKYPVSMVFSSFAVNMFVLLPATQSILSRHYSNIQTTNSILRRPNRPLNPLYISVDMFYPRLFCSQIRSYAL